MSFYKDITLIITSQKNRAKYRNRLLKYINDEISNKIKVILITEMKTLKVKYKNVKVIKSIVNTFHYKLFTAQKIVNTKYVAWLADDDFFTKEYLEKSVEYLNDNPKCSCVDAFALRFNKNSQINLEDYCIPQYLWLQKNKKTLIKSNSFEKRIFYLDKHDTCGTSVHGVCRNKIFGEFVKTMQKNSFLNKIKYGDKIFVFLMYLNGYIKHLFLVGQLRKDFENQSEKKVKYEKKKFENIIYNKEALKYLSIKLKKKNVSNKKNFTFLKFYEKIKSKERNKVKFNFFFKVRLGNYLISNYSALKFYILNFKILNDFNKEFKKIKKNYI